MKKIFSLFMVVLVAIGLEGCLGVGRDVEKFSMTVNDATGTAVLSFVPDYSKRTLEVLYKKDYSDEKVQDFTATGLTGGENFDEFEAMVKIVKNYDNTEAKPVVDKQPSLVAIVEGKSKGIVEIKVGIENSDQKIKGLMDFYYDIVELLAGATHI